MYFKSVSIIFSLVGAMKISTVCLPLRFKKDETFENSNVIVSGFGDELKNGSKLFEHLRELHPDGILNEYSILFFVKLYLMIIRSISDKNLP